MLLRRLIRKCFMYTMLLLSIASCESKVDAVNTADSDTGPAADLDSDADSDTDGDGDSDTDSDADSDTDGDGDSDTDGDGDSDTDSDGDSDTDSNMDPNLDSESDITDVPDCIDGDSDGWCLPFDCDDSDPNIHPGAPEVPDNGIDEDCNGVADDMPSVDTVPREDWLIHTNSGKLWHIDIETAEVTPVCDLVPTNPNVQPIKAFSSLTFARNDRLFGSSSDGGSVWEIFLPTHEEPGVCPCKQVAKYSQNEALGVFGICPDEGNNLYGVAVRNNSLIHFNVETKKTRIIGKYDYASYSHAGATWVDASQDVMAMLRPYYGSSILMDIDTTTGQGEKLADLSETINNVGIEHHPHNGKIYACTSRGDNPPPLYEVALDGTMTLVGLMDLPGGCTNLGAPWGYPELIIEIE